jgi:myo-inositol-1-phosphate synthase
MLVGCFGMTASAVVAGTQASAGTDRDLFGVCSHPAFNSIRFASCSDVVFGGWDYRAAEFSAELSRYSHLPPRIVEGCRGLDIPAFKGIETALDYPSESLGRFVRRPSTVEEGAEEVAQDIQEFRRSTGCNVVVVVYLGSPSRRPSSPDLASARVATGSDEVPSGVIYAMGAITAGAHFVDFTPSYTLEYRSLWDLAATHGVQLAGRDGSTGQTMLKSHLAELLEWRGLLLDAWYSTNLIGNRDGLVLSQPEYRDAKLRDKMDALRLDRDSNRISIDYLPLWGDRKEAWDAVECRTWFDTPLSIRINWRGSDSELAAPMILDLVRFMALGEGLGLKGFQPQLGFFFKRPFEREATSLSSRWRELLLAYVGSGAS